MHAKLEYSRGNRNGDANWFRFILLVSVKHGICHGFTDGHIHAEGNVFGNPGAAQNLGDGSRCFIAGIDAAGQSEFGRLWIHNKKARASPKPSGRGRLRSKSLKAIRKFEFEGVTRWLGTCQESRREAVSLV